MFDCVGLIKAVLWDFPKTEYKSNGVPDFGDWNIKQHMHDIKTMGELLEVGEIVFMNGHVGVYVGNNFVIEATPAFNDGVCKTNLHARAWLGHGKLNFIDYEVKKPKPVAKKTTEEIAKEVLQGIWGNGTDRKKRLEEAGYKYSTIQKKVNELSDKASNEKPVPKKSVDEIAKEVLKGLWGNGTERKKRLEEAGYEYTAIQQKVNKMVK